LFFVGHIAIAFLIVYALAIKFSYIRKTVSIALVMFLSIVPDIDIIFKLAGIELGHRTITHSAIISIAIGGAAAVLLLIIFFLKKTRQVQVALAGLVAYLAAYLSHIVIGDVIIGPINTLYPFGNLVINGTIKNGSLAHIMIEIILLSTMAAIVVISYYFCQTEKRKDFSLFFGYHRRLDRFFYPLLMCALIISLVFLLQEAGTPDLSWHSIYTIPLLILLHLSAVFIIAQIWVMSRKVDSSSIPIL
jgi:membrane-bound metal-dependent hydrolase YbcI (DUF457 family)